MCTGEYFYDPYGNLIKMLGGNGQPVKDKNNVDITTNIQDDPGFNHTYMYSGYLYDSEIGLYFLNARYYAAGIGRFLTKDTVLGDPGNPKSLNRYAYSYGDPVDYMDPDGHNPLAFLAVALEGLLVVAAEWLVPAAERYGTELESKVAGEAEAIAVRVEIAEKAGYGFILKTRIDTKITGPLQHFLMVMEAVEGPKIMSDEKLKKPNPGSDALNHTSRLKIKLRGYFSCIRFGKDPSVSG